MNIPELEAMLESDQRSNRYVESDNIMIYVRVTKRLIGRELVETLDIANVQVDQQEQNKGIFKSFLDYAEKLANKYNRTVYIESVLNPLLIEKLPIYGYTATDSSASPNFFKSP